MKRISFSVLLLAILTVTCIAQEVGYVLTKTGPGKISCVRNSKKVELKEKDKVKFDDEISTDAGVKAELVLDVYDDNPQIIIKPGSKIKLKAVKNKPKKSSIFLRLGRLFFSGSGKSHHGFKVETYNSVAGIEGTKFEVEYLEEKKITNLNVFEGLVKVQKKVNDKVVSPILPGGKPLFLNAGEGVQIKGFTMNKSGSVMKGDEIEKEILKWNPTAMVEIDKENLVTDGEHKLYIRFLHNEKTPLPVAVRVYLNGCTKLNGEEMVYSPVANKRFVLENLEEGEYKLKFLCCGYDYERYVSIPLENENNELKIFYTKKTVKYGFKGIGFLEQVELKKCYQKYTKAYINSKPVKLLNSADGVLEIPEALRYTVRGNLYFFIPAEIDKEIDLKFVYEGSKELKNTWKSDDLITGNTIRFNIRKDIDIYNGKFELK